MDRPTSEQVRETPEDGGTSRLERRDNLGSFEPVSVGRVLHELKTEDDMLEEMLDRES